MRNILVALVLFGLCSHHATAQTAVEKNVIYGMYSGLALLMDVHRPEKPNGYGVIFISGSGWQAQLGYGAPALKESQISDWGPALLGAGYTVFTLNHRAAPRFHYPAAVEDVQRAVRFVRHNADRFKVDPNRIGGLGGSSGGHLVGLVAMLGAPGISDDRDPVNREPATLQCVVLRAAPSDLKPMLSAAGVGPAAVVSFMERAGTPDDEKLYHAASPISHVSKSSPPVLLLHGDADGTVPYQQSVAFEAALRAANVPVKLVRVAGGQHGSDFGTAGKPHPDLPKVQAEAVSWLDRYLKSRGESLR
jgi:acetyl esterase/lipase